MGNSVAGDGRARAGPRLVATEQADDGFIMSSRAGAVGCDQPGRQKDDEHVAAPSGRCGLRFSSACYTSSPHGLAFRPGDEEARRGGRGHAAVLRVLDDPRPAGVSRAGGRSTATTSSSRPRASRQRPSMYRWSSISPPASGAAAWRAWRTPREERHGRLFEIAEKDWPAISTRGAVTGMCVEKHVTVKADGKTVEAIAFATNPSGRATDWTGSAPVPRGAGARGDLGRAARRLGKEDSR